MRFTHLFGKTLRQAPAEAETPNHQLLLRARLISQLTAGVYSYLPLGWRALLKIRQIIREEMDAAGGQEVMLPGLQPVELWEESGRRKALRRHAVRAQGPPRPRAGAGPDARGGHRRPVQAPRPELPRAANHDLPDADEVPRRAAPPRRPDAHARVHDDGPLQLRRRLRRPRRQLREDAHRLQELVRPLRRADDRRSWPTRAPSAARTTTSSCT